MMPGHWLPTPSFAVLPTSEVLVVAGMLIQSYTISSSTFQLAPSRSFPARPDGIPWTYPQTGVATLLPLDPANNYAAKVGLHSFADLSVSSPVKTSDHVKLVVLCTGKAIALKFLRLITDAVRVATAVMSPWCTVLFRSCQLALPEQFVLPQVLAACGNLWI